MFVTCWTLLFLGLCNVNAKIWKMEGYPNGYPPKFYSLSSKVEVMFGSIFEESTFYKFECLVRTHFRSFVFNYGQTYKYYGVPLFVFKL